MAFKTLRDLDLNNKTVLLRADLNVPVQNGNVSDTTRIDRLKPTIDYLNQYDCKVIILSHYGRPKGQINMDYSLSFLPPTLEKQWDIKVGFGEDSTEKFKLFENLRFNAGEEANDTAYAQELATLGDLSLIHI